MNHNPNFIVVNVNGGLGNRLRGLINGLFLVDRLRLQMKLVWPEDSECQCAFHELFDNDIMLLPQRGKTSRIAFHESALTGPINYYGKRCADDPEILPGVILPVRESDFDETCHIVYDSPKLLKFIDRQSCSRILHTLEVKNNILLEVENFCTDNKISESTYGVHIRRTDHTHRNNNYYFRKIEKIISVDSSARFFPLL